MIYKVHSLLVAQSIIELVQNDERMHERRGFIEAYQNGREQGLLIFNTHESCFYCCVHRNGNMPTVYHGKYSMQSISDDAYRHVNNFGNPQDAANWIIDNWQV